MDIEEKRLWDLVRESYPANGAKRSIIADYNAAVAEYASGCLKSRFLEIMLGNKEVRDTIILNPGTGIMDLYNGVFSVREYAFDSRLMSEAFGCLDSMGEEFHKHIGRCKIKSVFVRSHLYCMVGKDKKRALKALVIMHLTMDKRHEVGAILDALEAGYMTYDEANWFFKDYPGEFVRSEMAGANTTLSECRHNLLSKYGGSETGIMNSVIRDVISNTRNSEGIADKFLVFVEAGCGNLSKVNFKNDDEEYVSAVIYAATRFRGRLEKVVGAYKNARMDPVKLVTPLIDTNCHTLVPLHHNGKMESTMVTNVVFTIARVYDVDYRDLVSGENIRAASNYYFEPYQ